MENIATKIRVNGARGQKTASCENDIGSYDLSSFWYLEVIQEIDDFLSFPGPCILLCNIFDKKFQDI
jgi:hypothetical protein